MKTVILAGGMGTRLSEETNLIPKPMSEIGGKPILWHIMKYCSSFGLNDFIICCGYKGYVIKEYFSNYFLHLADVTIHLKDGRTEVHRNDSESWKVTLVDTGDQTGTAGRLKRVRKYVGDETFLMTYGDGLANVDISKLIQFHKRSKTISTVTSVQPPGRFGSLKIQRDLVAKFQEKPLGDGQWINGGFFVLEPKVISYIKNEASMWEGNVMPILSQKKQLAAFKHKGFWYPMDTMRDKQYLEKLWHSGQAPWKIW